MGKDIVKSKVTFQFCDGGSCRKANSESAVREARAYIRNSGQWDSTHTIRTLCNGRCEDAPTWIVQPGNFWYKNVTPEKAIQIVDSHTNKNKPVDEYLLYQDSWNHIASEKEIQIKPIVFKEKEDKEYGKVLLARASASDQYLYPLFKKLFHNPKGLQINRSGIKEVINVEHQVIYTDTFDMKISGEQTNFMLAIGPIKKAIEKQVSQEVKDRKVATAEVIWKKSDLDYQAYIRLKNKMGIHLVTLGIPKEDKGSWNYILNIYLNMDVNKPLIEKSLEKQSN